MTLKARIAKALGMTLADAQSFSLHMLREMVRESHPKLHAEASEAIRSGAYVRGEV